MRFIPFFTMALAIFASVASAQKPVEPPESSPASPGGSRSRRPSSPPMSYGGTITTTFSPSKGDSIPPVMIKFSEADAKAAAGLEEDVFVMARVISRTLERAEGDKVKYKLGVPMLLTGSGRSVRPMYIEGLGPLFMIKVSFPLLPPAAPEEKTSKKKNNDSEWDEAQRDVFAADAWTDEPDRDASFSEERVALLKRELVGALKSAANMRGLKPEEFVNIAVFGHAPPVRIKSISYPASGEVGIGLPAARVVYGKNGAAQAGRGSVLTLRARKSDIDEFSSGKLDTDAFTARVATTAYNGSGIGITSINSWIQEGSGRFPR